MNMDNRLSLVELVAAARAANPQAFTNLEQGQAVKIVLAALDEINRQIDKTAEGPVRIVRFGTFQVRRVPDKSGQTGSSGGFIRRVFFSRWKTTAASSPLKP